MTMTLDGSGASTIGVPNSATAKSATGTSVDFTSIPAGVKRITVMFSGVSTNGTSLPQIQIGSSGGIENTGYTGTSMGTKATIAVQQMSAGFTLSGTGLWAATYVVQGNVILTNVSGNIWSIFGSLGASQDNIIFFTAGSKTLSGTLDRVRITTVNGTDTFDAGSINILYE